MRLLRRLFSKHRYYLPRISALVILSLLFLSTSSVSATTTSTFSNSTSIDVTNGAPAAGTPFPSNIVVSGLNGAITSVKVGLFNETHLRPDDFDIALVGPGGVSVMLQSDAGGSDGISGVNLTIQDGATAIPNNDSGGSPIVSGTYAPTNWASSTDPGDPLITSSPGGALGTSLSVFNGANPNTTWKLYVVDDRNGTGSGAGIKGGWSITITVNEAPTANVDDYNGSAGNTLNVAAAGVLANDSDPESDGLTAELVSDVTNGTLALSPDGSFSYTPDSGFSGDDSFTYHAKDANSTSNTATVTIHVAAPNGVPVVNAGPDQDGDINVPFNVAATYTDSDAGDSHTATIDWGDGSSDNVTASGGAVNGSHTYTAVGNYTVTVTVTDNGAPPSSGSDTLQANITDPSNPGAPTATPLPYSPPTPTPLPLLTDYNGVNIDDVVHSDVPLEARYGIFARLLVRNGVYLPNVNSGSIGDPFLLNLGVIHAIDITVVSGDTMSGGIHLCFAGEGTLYFLNAAGAPRIAELLDSTFDGGNTCGYIFAPGTVVMTDNAAPIGQTAPVTNEALADCQITTQYRVNLREQPSMDANIILILRYNLKLKPTERTADWFHVVTQNYDGWIAAQFVSTNGKCDIS